MPRARVLAYLRVSGQEQGRSGTSLEAQRDEIARWARANEHASPAFYSEIESGSAARTEARAERAKIESAIAEENRAEEQARAAADPARRRELLAGVRGMRAAWGAASRMVWRTVEELLGASYSGPKRRPAPGRKA